MDRPSVAIVTVGYLRTVLVRASVRRRLVRYGLGAAPGSLLFPSLREVCLDPLPRGVGSLRPVAGENDGGRRERQGPRRLCTLERAFMPRGASCCRRLLQLTSRYFCFVGAMCAWARGTSSSMRMAPTADLTTPLPLQDDTRCKRSVSVVRRE